MVIQLNKCIKWTNPVNDTPHIFDNLLCRLHVFGRDVMLLTMILHVYDTKLSCYIEIDKWCHYEFFKF